MEGQRSRLVNRSTGALFTFAMCVNLGWWFFRDLSDLDVDDGSLYLPFLATLTVGIGLCAVPRTRGVGIALCCAAFVALGIVFGTLLTLLELVGD